MASELTVAAFLIHGALSSSTLRSVGQDKQSERPAQTGGSRARAGESVLLLNRISWAGAPVGLLCCLFDCASSSDEDEDEASAARLLSPPKTHTQRHCPSRARAVWTAPQSRGARATTRDILPARSDAMRAHRLPTTRDREKRALMRQHPVQLRILFQNVTFSSRLSLLFSILSRRSPVGASGWASQSSGSVGHAATVSGPHWPQRWAFHASSGPFALASRIVACAASNERSHSRVPWSPLWLSLGPLLRDGDAMLWRGKAAVGKQAIEVPVADDACWSGSGARRTSAEAAHTKYVILIV